MTVWLLREVHYDGDNHILGVYTSEELALYYRAAYPLDATYAWFAVVEMDLVSKKE